MRKGIKRLVIKIGSLFVVLSLCIAVNVQAASFDCTKATTKVEKMICADAELSKLDEELGTQYTETLKECSKPDAVKTSQKKWLAERNKAKETNALKQAYLARIAELQQIKEKSETEAEKTETQVQGSGSLSLSGDKKGATTANDKNAKTLGYKGEFWLMRGNHTADPGKSQPLCRDFTSNLNEFRRIPFNECNPRLSPKHPEFSRPEWEEIPFDLEIIKNHIYSSWVPPHTPKNEAEAAKRWQMWLDKTEIYRQSGKAQMWRTRIDIDGDGKVETLTRAVPNSNGNVYNDPPWGCDYYQGTVFISETENKEVAKQFRGGDIIHYSKDNRYYSIGWNSLYASTGGGGPESECPDIGGTATVDIEHITSIPGSSIIRGGLDCLIHWVPTGNYHSPAVIGQ